MARLTDEQFINIAVAPSLARPEEIEDLCADLQDALAKLAQYVWRDIGTAPEDVKKKVLVYAPEREGLPAIICPCAWHPDAGFCVDEIRIVTHWMSLPDAPEGT